MADIDAAEVDEAEVDDAGVDQIDVRHRISASATARRIRAHFVDPFSRNAYPLLVNTAVTGVLGVVYWVLAARHYSDASVGRASATIAVMTMLSGIVAYNLNGTLIRFVGASGGHTRRLVGQVYLGVAGVVAAITVVFLLTLGHWGPLYSHLGGLGTGLSFVVVVVAAALFTLQDHVLIGLRGAKWVAVENSVFGVVKIALLVLFAASLPQGGIYWAWVIPMALLLLPVNLLIFGRLIPGRVRDTQAVEQPLARAQVGRFLVADYVGTLCLFATVHLVPVLVATQVSAGTFGYFYIAWTIGGVLNLVAVNMASALTVEAVYDASRMAQNLRSAMTRTLGLLLVAALGLAVIAPYGLALLGAGYLDAAPLLQLLAFAALPKAVTEIYIGVLRVQRRTGEITRVQVIRAALVLVSVLVGLAVSGLTGIGLGVLVSQSAAAALVLPGLWRVFRTRPDAEARRRLPRLPRLPGLAAVRVRLSWDNRIAGLSVLTGVALALYLVPLRTVDLVRMNGYGLISVLPLWSVLGAALLTLAFVLTLALSRARRFLLGAQVLGTVVCLHAVAALVEPLPRFATAWVHLGLVDYIARTGTTAPTMDGRFGWPGFFGLVAFVGDAVNQDDLTLVLALTPVVSNLLYLLAFALLLREMRVTWRARWFAGWLFCVLNWVGQDYFSPQGYAYLLYLLVIAGLVAWFRPASTTYSGELPPREVGRRAQVTLLMLVVALYTVATASHQLTPFLMLAACAGLVVVGRCRLTGLPHLMGVIVVAWVSFMASVYWSGHLDVILGGVGQVWDNFSGGVAGRAVGSDPQHMDVLHVRIATTVALFALAGLGALRRRIRGIDDRVALVLIVTPFVSVGMQSYGGEILLRAYLFALPAACLLAAYLFFPEVSDRRPVSPRVLGATAVCALVLVGAFFVNRYGNERFEYVRPGELAAMDYIYERPGTDVEVLWLGDHASDGATAAMVNGYQDIEDVGMVAALAPRDPANIGRVVDRLRELGANSYLVTARSHAAYLEMTAGYPADWGHQIRARLAAVPALRTVVANPDAAVYTLRDQPDEAPGETASAPAGRSGSTPLTPVGLVCLGLLVPLLVTREVLRLRPGRDMRHRLRALTVAAWVLTAGLAVVVVERLVVLA